MGAATASNGAVGLYHVANLTPEACELGEALITENAQTLSLIHIWWRSCRPHEAAAAH